MLYSIVAYYTWIYSVYSREVTSWKLFSLISLCSRFVKCAQMCGLTGYRPQSPGRVWQTQAQGAQPSMVFTPHCLQISLESVSVRPGQSVAVGRCGLQQDLPLSSHRCFLTPAHSRVHISTGKKNEELGFLNCVRVGPHHAPLVGPRSGNFTQSSIPSPEPSN